MRQIPIDGARKRGIADCRAGKIGIVITKDTDRLSRDMSQLFALLHIFAKADVRIEYSEGAGCDRLLNLALSAVGELEEAKARAAGIMASHD